VASYSPVFSAQFIVYTDAAPILAYEVPSGFTAVVRDFSLYTEAGGVVGQLLLADAAGSPECVVASIGALGVAAYGQWQGRIVAPGGAFLTLSLTSEDLGTSAYVGGYLLRNNLT